MKKIIKKTAFILIFCFATVHIFSPIAFASHNRNNNNGTTENWGKGGKWLDFTGIVLATAVLVGVSGGIYFLLKKGPDFSDKKKDEESEKKIEALEKELKELKFEKKDKNYKAEENNWSVYEERHKQKEEGIEIWKRRGEDNQKNKKLKSVFNDSGEENNEIEENEEKPGNKIKQVDF